MSTVKVNSVFMEIMIALLILIFYLENVYIKYIVTELFINEYFLKMFLINKSIILHKTVCACLFFTDTQKRYTNINK